MRIQAWNSIGFGNRSKGSVVDTIARKYQVDIILAKETQVRWFRKPVLNRIWPSRSCGGSPDPVTRYIGNTT